jgi:chemotaxis protein CheD
MSEVKIIKVGMGDLQVVHSPHILVTLGLGSCIGIALYDEYTQIGGLAHIMLPDSTQIKNHDNMAKFADTGIEELVKQMVNQGAHRFHLKAKIAGGAQMFDFKNTDEVMRIGLRNQEAVKKTLKNLNIPIIASDLGENYGRTVELHTDTGALVIKTIGHGVKTI